MQCGPRYGGPYRLSRLCLLDPGAVRPVVFSFLALISVQACAPPTLLAATTDQTSAAEMREKYRALKEPLANSPFHQPLLLESRQAQGRIEGDVYALVGHRFELLRSSLVRVSQWCEVLMLHLNVQACQAGSTPGDRLTLYLGRKYFEPLERAERIDFTYRVDANTPDYLAIRMEAAGGPFGTHDFRIHFQGIPIDATHSFLHFTYSYAFGTMARIAMEIYLATLGQGKVGFTVVGKRADGNPKYIRGLRGIVERNVMRYYLAIDAYLGALSRPPAGRFEKSMRDWFAGTERYAHQLHELDEAEYLTMKREEYRREQAPR